MNKLSWQEAQEQIKTGVTFLDFSTEWCGDCKMMEPVIDNVESEINLTNNDVKFIEVDAEEANLFRQVDSQFKVLKVPSFYIVKDGVAKHIGYEYQPFDLLVESIKEATK